jgi:hypothetical protein
MSPVWIMKDGLTGISLIVDRFLERADRVRIGRLVEADMAVADLQEGQPFRFGRLCRADKAQRARHAARNGPEHAGAGPGHAFKDAAAAHPAPVIMVVVIAHEKSPWSLDWVPRA